MGTRRYQQATGYWSKKEKPQQDLVSYIQVALSEELPFFGTTTEANISEFSGGWIEADDRQVVKYPALRFSKKFWLQGNYNCSSQRREDRNKALCRSPWGVDLACWCH